MIRISPIDNYYRRIIQQTPRKKKRERMKSFRIINQLLEEHIENRKMNRKRCDLCRAQMPKTFPFLRVSSGMQEKRCCYLCMELLMQQNKHLLDQVPKNDRERFETDRLVANL